MSRKNFVLKQNTHITFGVVLSEQEELCAGATAVDVAAQIGDDVGVPETGEAADVGLHVPGFLLRIHQK